MPGSGTNAYWYACVVLMQHMMPVSGTNAAYAGTTVAPTMGHLTTQDLEAAFAFLTAASNVTYPLGSIVLRVLRV